MKSSRRDILLTGLLGAGCVGLRALATGLPSSLLLGEGTARADTPPTSCTRPQKILLFTSASGDPLNANVPGTYDSPGILHSADARMAPTDMTLGGKGTRAAKPWTTLPADTLARTCFFHHATYTNNHGDAEKVNDLMGAVRGREMLVSLLGTKLATCLGTIQQQPLVLAANLVTFQGAVMPVLSPSKLGLILGDPTGPLADLQKIRDTNLDRMNAVFKKTGTKVQRDLLDRYALSQTQARSLSTQLLADLATIRGDNYREDQNIAAAVLFKMNISPVVVGTYGFGGDNHADRGLAGETQDHVDSLAALASLMGRLKTYGIADNVTVVFQNVFGRTLSATGSDARDANGRGHHAYHHCSVIIGAGVKASVIGAVKPTADGSDFQATAIASASGAGTDGGDIPYEETLGAVGKTLGAAVGIDAATLDGAITKGKIVPAALA